ncbi:Nuclear apoptosis-inducing factor 1 [Triplophysa tibetana]|uniref:Nuclear apoptosis-inducing factor 1 n=1 Tax=Triplophysa tibetana TaxID=1572043 RepID=A0A5A9PSX3_9TELE|nr:Nuclear apoptosis-inducing factor 1 [Triplophysa tibetana]
MKSLTHTPLPNKKDIIREQGSVRKTASVSTRPLPAVPYGRDALVLGTSGNSLAPADSALGVSSHWSPADSARIRTKPIVHNATHTGLADNRGHSGLHWGQIGGAFAPTSRTQTLSVRGKPFLCSHLKIGPLLFYIWNRPVCRSNCVYRSSDVLPL